MIRVHDVAQTADFISVRAVLAGEDELDPAQRLRDALRWEQGRPR